ncbi:MAG: prolyl oligopeptidase family serine peptidase, partial [Chitinophagaceae bacterium]|nr:prolyl oligopeptidase family serine peptidase [Chitinophagaceae bacterium]
MDLLTNRTRNLEAIGDVSLDNTEQWLLGKRSGNAQSLVLYHLPTGKTIFYDNVQDYQLTTDCRSLFIRFNTFQGLTLQHISLPYGKKSIVYSSDATNELVNYYIDSTGTGISYTLRDKKVEGSAIGTYSYWYYRLGDAKAKCLVTDHSRGIPTGARLTSRGGQFTRDGRYLLFGLRSASFPEKIGEDAVQLDVWTYRDVVFYTSQPAGYAPVNFPYTAVVSVEEGKVTTFIQQKHDNSVIDPERIGGDYAVVIKSMVGDRFWEYSRDSIWLVSLIDGSRKLLPFVQIGNPFMLEIDKAGKSIIVFDKYRGRHFYRYDIASGREIKLSANVPDWTLGVENPFFVGWQETEKVINPVIAARTENEWLVYDSYDIWQIDLSGHKKAINLTSGYGLKNEIVFRVAQPENAFISTTTSLLLTAFSERTKANGFYRTAKGNPDSLFMGPYFFSHRRLVLNNWILDPYGPGMLPLKAARAKAWIVKRESATEAPNLFFTKDFKTFNHLTDVQPQKEYNWYSTELVNFTQTDGIQNQGVLFKPANFDPNKKYPILYYCYEQYSYLLNKFIPAEVSESGKPNIPWFVSRGYLVFTPDHYFRKGSRYNSVLLAAEGAVQELKKRPYVNGTKTGIIGLSQAGGFTNYIITHSKLFAAAFEGCGVSDMVSGVLQLTSTGFDEGESRLAVTEPLWGSNMWDHPEYWVTESPIVLAHRVTTPLLISHNKVDGAVKFDHAVSMFTAMRRLNKKVWLLQYDKGGHGLGGKDALDQTIRMTQYFDYYLKGASPPRWMTQGIP